VVVGPDGQVAYDETQALRTADAVSPALRGEQVLGSVIGFGLLYCGLLAVWLFVLDRKIRQGPVPASAGAASADWVQTAGKRVIHDGGMTGQDGDGSPRDS
jgi:hypothetical protein